MFAFIFMALVVGTMVGAYSLMSISKSQQENSKEMYDQWKKK